MKLFLTSSFLLLFLFPIYSQMNQVERIELDPSLWSATVELYELGDEGFIIAARSEKMKKGIVERQYHRFDTSFQSVETSTFSHKRNFGLKETCSTKNRIHSLFKEFDGGFLIRSTKPKSLEFIEVNGNFPPNTTILNMVALGEFLYVDTKIKGKPTIFTINWKSGKLNAFPIDAVGNLIILF